MTEQEKKVIIECLQDTAKVAEDTVYETLALLFEEMAKIKSKDQSIGIEEILLAISQGLRTLIDKKENQSCHENL